MPPSRAARRSQFLNDYAEMGKHEVRAIKLPSFFIQPHKGLILLRILEYTE